MHFTSRFSCEISIQEFSAAFFLFIFSAAKICPKTKSEKKNLAVK